MFARFISRSKRLNNRYSSRNFTSLSARAVFNTGKICGIPIGAGVGWFLLDHYYSGVDLRQREDKMLTTSVWDPETATTWKIASIGVDEDKNGEYQMAISLKAIGIVSHIKLKCHYNVPEWQENDIEKQFKFQQWSSFKHPINGHIYQTEAEYKKYRDRWNCGEGSKVMHKILNSRYLPPKYTFAVRAYDAIMRNKTLARKYRGKWVYVEPIYDESDRIVTKVDAYIFDSEKALLDNIEGSRRRLQVGGYYNCMGLEYLSEKK